MQTKSVSSDGKCKGLLSVEAQKAFPRTLVWDAQKTNLLVSGVRQAWVRVLTSSLTGSVTLNFSFLISNREIIVLLIG